MANRKISDLTALTAPASGDLLPIVDISEAAAANKNKKITYGELLASAPLGSAAAPSIAFEGDINTGLYSPGADQLAISTGGTGRVFVDASGNVGIGTSSPGSKLDVVGDISTNGSLLARTTAQVLSIVANTSLVNNTARIELYGTTSASPKEIIIRGDKTIFTLADASEKARIDSSGRLGIGTSSPGYLLTVSGGATSLAANQYLRFGAGIFASGDGSATNYLFTGSSGLVIRNAADTSEFVRIDSSGRLGIGTTEPSNQGGQKLTVQNGSIAISNSTANGTNGELRFIGRPDGINYNWAGIRAISDVNVNQGTLVFLTSASNVSAEFSTERMRIDSSGRLLVGTSSAGSVLTKTIELANAGTGASQPAYQVYSFPGADPVNCGYFQFYKSRGASVGTNTIVASGDILGNLRWYGANGTGYDIAAEIKAEVDGTPGANDMPGRLVFSTTADGASSPTERYRITNDGVLCHDQPAPISKSAAATLTIAELKTAIIQYTGAAATLTLPTGSNMEGGFSGIYTNMTFAWSVINTGSGICTIGAGTAHTIVGSGTVAIGASARFTSRRTAANTFVSYRLS